MADTELYGWNLIRAYHTVWAQQLKNGRAEWADYEVKMEIRKSLVWHSAGHGTKVKQQPSAGGFKKPTRETLSKVVPATPQTRACIPYNDGKCTIPDEHPKVLHICSYCLVAAKRQCAHQERFCQRKMYESAGPKYLEAGVRQHCLTSK